MMRFALLVFVSVFLFSACGSEGPVDVYGSPTALKGTVASGAALEATVTIIDGDGNTYTTDSGSDGRYAIEMGGKTGPFIIKAEAASGEKYFSYSASYGFANITELTTLVMSLELLSGDLDTELANWSTNKGNWSRATIENGIAKVNANFFEEMTTAGLDFTTYDFFTEEFDTNEQGIDAVLAKIDISFDLASNTYSISDASTTVAISFDENISISGFYVGAEFTVDSSSQWTETLTTRIEGLSTPVVLGPFSVPAEFVPYNEERFLEQGMEEIAGTTFSVTTEDIELTIEVVEFKTNYTVTGDGLVGTVVKGELTYRYRYKYTAGGQTEQGETGFVMEVKYERTS